MAFAHKYHARKYHAVYLMHEHWHHRVLTPSPLRGRHAPQRGVMAISHLDSHLDCDNLHLSGNCEMARYRCISVVAVRIREYSCTSWYCPYVFVHEFANEHNLGEYVLVEW